MIPMMTPLIFYDPEVSGIFPRPNLTPPFAKMKRFFSVLKPAVYDIVLMESSPLRIYGIDNLNDIRRESLEYLHCALNDQDKLYEKIWQTLLRNSFQIRCGNLNGNMSAIKKLAIKDGGCHILQFVGHCCNPVQVAKDIDMNMNINQEEYELNKYYHDLTKHIKEPLDEYYILLECDVANDKHGTKHIIDGEWMPVSELQKYFKALPNDLVIVMSPFHDKMAEIFINMGYLYVIGIKTFAQSNTNTSHNWQVLDFLHHFYSAILNQECLARAFELAKTATRTTFYDTKSQNEQKSLVKLVAKLEGMAMAESKSEFNDEYYVDVDGGIHPIDQTDTNFILVSPQNSYQPSSDRFILFHQLTRGEPIDQMGSMLRHTRYQTNWNNIILKPFIGRAAEVIELYTSLIENKMIMVGGRENDGRKSIIKRLISWLYEHNYFDDGLFVLDCKSELMHKKPLWNFQDIICFKLSNLGYKVQQQQMVTNKNTRKHQQKPSNLNIIIDDKDGKNKGKCKASKAADIAKQVTQTKTSNNPQTKLLNKESRYFSRGALWQPDSLPVTKNNVNNQHEQHNSIFSIGQPVNYMGSVSINSY